MRINFWVLGFIAILGANTLSAQGDQSIEFNRRRNEINRKAMLTWGIWSLTNIGLGSIQYPTSDGRSRFFHEMSIGWNAVTLGIAGFGYFRTRSAGVELSPAKSRRAQRGTERWLLLNAGADVAAIAAGFYLISRGNGSSLNGERLQGYGLSLIFQGGFLFAFDAVVFLFHKDNAHRFGTILKNISISNQKIGLRRRF